MRSHESTRKLHGTVLAGVLLLLVGLLVARPVWAGGSVRGSYFYSPDCPHCQTIMTEVLPKLQERFGANLELRMFDLQAEKNKDVLRRLEAQAGVSGGEWPELFIGRDALVGEPAIRSGAAALIEKYLAAGGVDYPSPDLPAPPETPAPQPTPGGGPLIHLAYFYSPGCAECDRVASDLVSLGKRHPNLVVTRFSNVENLALHVVLGRQARLSEKQNRVAPALFVGNDALVDKDISLASLETLVAKYAVTGASASWERVTQAQLEAAGQGIAGDVRTYGILTMVGAGLFDGLNPCAFATVVFFVSYLAFVGRSRKEMLLVGSAFTLGVFIAYLAAGLTAMRIVEAITQFHIVRQGIYGLMGGLCLVLAGVSIHDAWQAYQGKPEAMRMRLPRVLRQRVNRVIREHSSRSAFVAVAGLTGLVVSLIELACTGQVYLPSIMSVVSRPELRSQAVGLLVLYNLFFVLPLIVVFVVASLGVGSQKLASIVQKHTGTVKILTAVVFAVLGVWMLTTVL